MITFRGANLGEVGKKEPPKGSATAKYRAITSNIRDASTTSNERTIDDSEGTVAKRQK